MPDLPASLGPILCAPLLRTVDGLLLELLRSLAPAEWHLPTVAPAWQVRDVAAHLLDTVLRKLSLVRDDWVVETPTLRSPHDLAAFINRLNHEGVTVYRRLSPPLLIGLMQMACAQSADFHEALDPFAPAIFPVSWAGEESSPNWFDTARELTERWHHQQQIRLATGRPGLLTPEIYHPVLDCFLRGLPYAYRAVKAPTGTTVLVEISGACGGEWFLVKASPDWYLAGAPAAQAAARIVLPQELAWRLFTKGVDRAAAHTRISIEGDRSLAEPVLSLTAIVS